METHIERAKTALVVIDLQQGIVGMETAPHAAKDVAEHAAELTEAFRKNEMPVVLVRVSFSPHGENALKPQTDGTAMSMSRPAGWDEIVPALGPKEGDIVITKHQWGAFYGTALDLELRRRGIDTIVLCGISTNIGVESTASFAYEYGYQQIFVEDATSARTKEEHEHTMKTNFPRMGRVRSTREIIEALL